MKFFIVFACVLAVVAANEDANVIRNDSEMDTEYFKYAYELDNHVKAKQDGILLTPDTFIITGEYSYISPEGEHIYMQYTADEFGYHVDAASPLLPTPPPTPAHILKAIEYIKSHPSADAHA